MGIIPSRIKTLKGRCMPLLISVIIPVYNIEKYLSECIASVVNQSYRSLEIILVDDGSSDKSGKICDEWAQRDNRIKVIHKVNEGVSEARNTGIKECTGQLIGFVDGDDWIDPEMYQTLVERLLKSEADVVMCGYYDYPYGLDKPIIKGNLVTEDGTFEETAISIIKRNGYFTSVWNKLFRRKCIFREDKTILMDPTLSYGEDEVWLYEVLRNCDIISFVPQPLYHWRPREGSMTRIHVLSKHKTSIVNAKKRALELLPSSKSVQSMAKGMIYNSLCGLKTIAYITKDRDNYKKISEFISPFRFDYIRSTEIRAVRKIKMCLLETLMIIRMPAVFIEKIYNIR